MTAWWTHYKSREEVEANQGRWCLQTTKNLCSYVFLCLFGTHQTLVSFFSTNTFSQIMVSSFQSSLQCVTCQLVLFLATSPLCSSRLFLNRWLNQGHSSWRLQLWALFFVRRWLVATFLWGIWLFLLTKRWVQPHLSSRLFLLIWLPLREKLGLHMLLLFLLLLVLSLQVGYVFFSFFFNFCLILWNQSSVCSVNLTYYACLWCKCVDWYMFMSEWRYTTLQIWNVVYKIYVFQSCKSMTFGILIFWSALFWFIIIIFKSQIFLVIL